MPQKQPDIHDIDRINQYQEASAWEKFIALWTSKLGIIIGVLTMLFAFALIAGFVSLPTIVWGETELVVVLSSVAALTIGSWFIVIPMLSLHSTPFELLIKVNSTHDSILNAWVMHPVRMAKVSVTEGRAYSDTIRGIPVYFVREYDPDTREAEGTWRGESTDVEIETKKQEIEANRGRLRRWARIGMQLHSKLPSIAQSIESSYWKSMSDDDLARQAKHPDVMQSEVIEDVELLVDSMEKPGERDDSESKPDAEEMLEEGVEDEVGEMPSEWTGGSE